MRLLLFLCLCIRLGVCSRSSNQKNPSWFQDAQNFGGGQQQVPQFSPNEQANPPMKAGVFFLGSIRGFVHLSQDYPPAGETVITGTITGLTPGLHGFHIHQTGNLVNGCKSTGGHYNPFQLDHGAPYFDVRHVGDLGNIMADESGNAVLQISDNQITLVGPNSVIGRAIVVHEGPDDLGLGGDHGSRTTGNAGGRVGCGVIGIA